MAQTMVLSSGVVSTRQPAVTNLKRNLQLIKPTSRLLYFNPLPSSSSLSSRSTSFSVVALFKSKTKAAPKKAPAPPPKVEDGIFGTSGGIGFTKQNELFVGRVAMIGFAASLLGEAVTGKGILSQLNLETGIPIYEAEPLLLFFILFTLLGAIGALGDRGRFVDEEPTGLDKAVIAPGKGFRAALGLPDGGPPRLSHLIFRISAFHFDYLVGMKASFKGKYDNGKSTAATTLVLNAGDVKLRASLTDATVTNGPSLNGLALAVEKPGFFILDYNVPKQDVRFQFMNTVRFADKPLNLTYIHSRGDNRTMLDGSLVIDSANKVSANYVVGTSNCKLKYSYNHGGLTTFEPTYDLAKNTWDFAVSRRVYQDDVCRATYQTSSKLLGLEWSRNSKYNGKFKVSASMNLAEESKMPKLMAETTWDIEM